MPVTCFHKQRGHGTQQFLENRAVSCSCRVIPLACVRSYYSSLLDSVYPQPTTTVTIHSYTPKHDPSRILRVCALATSYVLLQATFSSLCRVCASSQSPGSWCCTRLTLLWFSDETGQIALVCLVSNFKRLPMNVENTPSSVLDSTNCPEKYRDIVIAPIFLL